MVYTIRLDMARMNSRLRFRSIWGIGSGRGAHRIKASVRAIMGVRIKRICEEGRGRTGSLIKSLTPSATGWRIPNGPTTLGPLRCCI